MKHKVMKMMLSVAVAAFASCSWASPWIMPAKAVARGVEKIGAHVGAKAGGKVLVHGGEALAMATAERVAAKSASRQTAKTAASKTIGAALGKASPKQILAAGGAAAMVTAAHETADGVQTICENTGEAIGKNPNLAERMVQAIAGAVKMIGMLVSLAAFVVFGWLLWPVLVVTRNLFRLMAMRKMRRAHSAAAGFARVNALLFIAGFALLTALGIWRWTAGGDETAYAVMSPEAPVRQGRSALDQSALAARRAEVVAELRAEYDAMVTRLFENFRAGVDDTATAQFARIRDDIPGIVAKYGMLSKCAELMKVMALDKWKGGNRTTMVINADLEVCFYCNLYAARDAVGECLKRLCENLESANRAFKVKLEGELAAVELPGDEKYKTLLETCGERVEASKARLADAQLDMGIALAVEAICIRQTMAILGKVLGKAVARQVASMAAGGGLALADGPLPIGDVIAAVGVAGCTAWTAWDIYKATTVLPERMARTLADVTRDCERQCRDDVVNAARSIAQKL